MNQYPNQEQPPSQQYQGYAPRSSNFSHEYQQERAQADASERYVYQAPFVRRRLLGRRGLIGVAGAVVALLGFFLPYYATYSGNLLASLYGIYWLEVLFLVAAFALFAARLLLPSLEAHRRRWALVLAALGGGGAFIHYLLVTMDSVPIYWGVGAWLYCLGMIVVGISGLLLLV